MATRTGQPPTTPAYDPAETPLARTRRARRIVKVLGERHPDARIALDFTTPLECLVATVLSAQSTDKKINEVTPALFARYHTGGPTGAAELAGADREEMEALLKPTGFFRAKTTSVMGLGAALEERFGGEVPAKLADLVSLPGVGRKTANVVLGHSFGIPGITVDTHVGRLSRRFGFTEEDDPVKVEADLAALLVKREWTLDCDRIIFHGRRICHARRPACGVCPVAKLCPSYGLGPTDPAVAAKLVRGDSPEAIEAIS